MKSNNHYFFNIILRIITQLQYYYLRLITLVPFALHKEFSSKITVFATVPLITLPEDYSSLPYYLSFDLFSPLVTTFYIFSFFAALVVPYIFYIVSKYIIDTQYRKRFIITFVFASIVFFTIPLTLLIASILMSIPSLFFNLHYRFNCRVLNNLFSLTTSFLARHGILQFLLKLYNRLFLEISDFHFFFLGHNLFFFSLAYIAISRFYLLAVVTGNFALFSFNNVLLLNVTLFLCLFMWCLRLIVNLCFFIGSSKQTFIHFSLVGENPPSSPQPLNPQPSPQPNPLPSTRQFSFWNRYTYHNNYSVIRPRWYYIGNFTLGTCTLLLGCIGTYIGYEMWQTTIKSNLAMDKNSEAMDKNSKAMNRQADQADMEAGRMSEKEYMDKWCTNSDYTKLSDIEKLKLLDQWKNERKNK